MSRLTRAVLFALTVAGIACGGDGMTESPPLPQGFGVVLSSTSLSVEQGAAGTVTANITRSNGFAGTVNLSIEGLPTGITASFNPASITSSTAATTLSVTVAGTVAPGSYAFTIRGQSTGLSDQTAGVTLTVTARPSIAMTLSAPSTTIAAGLSTSVTATIARTNFTGTATIAVSGAPSGITSAVSTAGDVHTVTFNVASTVTAGPYVLTLTASGTGVTAVSAPFTLTVTAPVVASIALSASPTAFTVQPGSTPVGTVISIARTNFAGAVALSVQSGLPAGLTASFTPAGATTGNSVIANFSAAANVPGGTYNVVLQGQGSGATTGTVQLVITVAGIPGSSIALSAVPSTVTTAQGTSVGTTINITRTNITGAVTFTANNVPVGITATFNPAVSTQNASTLNLAVDVTVPVGSYQINVTGSATGVANVTIVITLNVTQGQVSNGNVTFTFCGASSTIPVWFAVQNAFGQWQRATPVATNTFSFTINTLGGVAWVTQTGTDAYAMTIAYGTFVDLNALGGSQCVSPATKTVTGTMAGIAAATDIVSVGLGGATASPPPTQANPAFTIAGVPTGSVDLLATRTTFNLASPTPLALSRIYLKRGLNPVDGSSLGTVDFAGADAFAPDSRQLTTVGVSVGEQVSARAVFLSANRGVADLGTSIGSSTQFFSAVPTSRTAVGDLHALSAFATTVNNNVITAARGVTAWSRDPAATTTLTLASPLTVPTITSIPGAPYARLRSVLSRHGEYDNAWVTAFTQPRRTVSISVTSGYQSNNGAVDVTIPDFTAVNGWQNVFGLLPATSTDWIVTASGWFVGGGSISEGAIIRSAYRQGSITP